MLQLAIREFLEYTITGGMELVETTLAETIQLGIHTIKWVGNYHLINPYKMELWLLSILKPLL
jgi:hypothetical protein